MRYPAVFSDCIKTIQVSYNGFQTVYKFCETSIYKHGAFI